MSESRKAVALISGGLDSMLAAKVILEQGIDVVGLNFFTGFCHSGHTATIRNPKKDKVIRNDALWVAETLGIELEIEDIVQEYKDIVINPKYGYGQHINPCLDCKVFMVKKAYEWMLDNGYDFLITGEVIGQRPKSQRKATMPVVEKQSGADDLLLRPLCAKLLPETKPEREGWVDRDALYDFNGRGRKGQMALAKNFEIKEFAQPAGGCCVLTDGHYAKRMQDMWAHRGSKEYEFDDIVLLKAGRHIRPRAHFKMIVARDMSENQFLEGYRHAFTHITIENIAGPLTLIEGETNQQDLELAASIAARYSRGKNEDSVTVKVHPKAREAYTLSIKPMAEQHVEKEWHI
jgi:tRNA-specific 2-thiouridylase